MHPGQSMGANSPLNAQQVSLNLPNEPSTCHDFSQYRLLPTATDTSNSSSSDCRAFSVTPPPSPVLTCAVQDHLTNTSSTSENTSVMENNIQDQFLDDSCVPKLTVAQSNATLLEASLCSPGSLQSITTSNASSGSSQQLADTCYSSSKLSQQERILFPIPTAFDVLPEPNNEFPVYDLLTQLAPYHAYYISGNCGDLYNDIACKRRKLQRESMGVIADDKNGTSEMAISDASDIAQKERKQQIHELDCSVSFVVQSVKSQISSMPTAIGFQRRIAYLLALEHSNLERDLRILQIRHQSLLSRVPGMRPNNGIRPPM